MYNTQKLKDKKARYHTLGCKLNFAETSTVQETLEKEGILTAKEGEEADICIINTCSVTDVADHKCRQIIRKIQKENPKAFMLVMGCYAQLKPNQVAEIEGVDLVLGMEQKGEVVRYLCERISQKANPETVSIDGGCHNSIAVPSSQIKTFVPSCSKGNRTRYFLKVQDGCNYYCTYCTIPLARGRSRNGSIQSMVEQVQKVVEEGGKEIVLTGVNMGDFGKSTNENFFQLIQALDKIEGIERYRISSIEPNLLTPEMIEFCAKSRAFMPHFHLPLQSGSNSVLRLMKRKYDTALFAERVRKIKEVMPDAFIGVDVIVGTRGETVVFFEETYDFLKSLPISQLHVFTYSERPGTAALHIPHIVTPKEKKVRSSRLLALSDEKTKEFYSHFINTERKVLWEHTKHGNLLKGFTDNYIKVVANTQQVEKLKNNIISLVRLGTFTENGELSIAEIIS